MSEPELTPTVAPLRHHLRDVCVAGGAALAWLAVVGTFMGVAVVAVSTVHDLPSAVVFLVFAVGPGLTGALFVAGGTVRALLLRQLGIDAPAGRPTPWRIVRRMVIGDPIRTIAAVDVTMTPLMLFAFAVWLAVPALVTMEYAIRRERPEFLVGALAALMFAGLLAWFAMINAGNWPVALLSNEEARRGPRKNMMRYIRRAASLRAAARLARAVASPLLGIALLAAIFVPITMLDWRASLPMLVVLAVLAIPLPVLMLARLMQAAVPMALRDYPPLRGSLPWVAAFGSPVLTDASDIAEHDARAPSTGAHGLNFNTQHSSTAAFWMLFVLWPCLGGAVGIMMLLLYPR